MAANSWLFSLRQQGLQKDFGGAIDSNEYKTNQKTKDKVHTKYWADSSGQDCYAVYARGLNIDNSYTSEYWQWTTDSAEGIEVAQAVKVKWLGVNGSFKTINLMYDVRYKVSFLLRMDTQGNMKAQTVNLTLTLPNDTNQEKQASLPSSTNWQELEVGQFVMTREYVGEMKFTMRRQFDSWMSGLVIKGVVIKPL